MPKKYTHFKKGKTVLTLQYPIFTDSNRRIHTRVTAAITGGAQIGYRQRLDTSDYGELLLEQRVYTFFGTPFICTRLIQTVSTVSL